MSDSERLKVDNEKLTTALIEYSEIRVRAEENGQEPPQFSDFIAKEIMKIIDNLGRSGNFNGYTWLSEMKGDALEACVKAVMKFNPEAKTRSGKPNGFGFLTQVSWFAFVNRIKKENKENAIKDSLIDNLELDTFLHVDNIYENDQIRSNLEQLKNKKHKSNDN